MTELSRHNLAPVAAATLVAMGTVAVKPNVAPAQAPVSPGHEVTMDFSGAPIAPNGAITSQDLAPSMRVVGQSVPNEPITSIETGEIREEVPFGVAHRYDKDPAARNTSAAEPAIDELISTIKNMQENGTEFGSAKVQGRASDEAQDQNPENAGMGEKNKPNRDAANVRGDATGSLLNKKLKNAGMENIDVRVLPGEEMVRKARARKLKKLAAQEGKSMPDIIEGFMKSPRTSTPAELKILKNLPRDRYTVITIPYTQKTVENSTDVQVDVLYAVIPAPEQEITGTHRHNVPAVLPERVAPLVARNDAPYKVRDNQASQNVSSKPVTGRLDMRPRPFNGHIKGKATRTRARAHGRSPQKQLSRTGR